MLIPVRTTQFKRDAKLAEKRGKQMSKLKTIMTKLAKEEILDSKYRDHKLGEIISIIENAMSNRTGF